MRACARAPSSADCIQSRIQIDCYYFRLFFNSLDESVFFWYNSVAFVFIYYLSFGQSAKYLETLAGDMLLNFKLCPKNVSFTMRKSFGLYYYFVHICRVNFFCSLFVTIIINIIHASSYAHFNQATTQIWDEVKKGICQKQWSKE